MNRCFLVALGFPLRDGFLFLRRFDFSVGG